MIKLQRVQLHPLAAHPADQQSHLECAESGPLLSDPAADRMSIQLPRLVLRTGRTIRSEGTTTSIDGAVSPMHGATVNITVHLANHGAKAVTVTVSCKSLTNMGISPPRYGQISTWPPR